MVLEMVAMTYSTSLYYFTNDLFREKGIRITIKDLEEIGKKYNTKITNRANKIGAPGFFSKYLLKNYELDIMDITVEGETEESVKNTLRELFNIYGPYETKRGQNEKIAKELKRELQPQT